MSNEIANQKMLICHAYHNEFGEDPTNYAIVMKNDITVVSSVFDSKPTNGDAPINSFYICIKGCDNPIYSYFKDKNAALKAHNDLCNEIRTLHGDID